MDPDPVEAGPDSAEARLCQVRTGEGSSCPGARAGQEEEGWTPGQALERQGGGAQEQVPYRYFRNMVYRIRIRLDWVRGRGQGSGRSQRQPRGSEGRQEVWVRQEAGVKLPVEAVGGCPRAEGRHDGQASSL